MNKPRLVIHKNFPKYVLEMKVKDLDINKCSSKFLEHNFDPQLIVLVTCDAKGNIQYRGKKQEYRLNEIKESNTSINLKELEKNLDRSLSNETEKTLIEWLKNKRKK